MLSDGLREDFKRMKALQQQSHMPSVIDTEIISKAPIVSIALSYKRVAANIVVFIFLATMTILTGAVIILGVISLLNWLISLSEWVVVSIVVLAVLAAIGGAIGLTDEKRYHD